MSPPRLASAAAVLRLPAGTHLLLVRSLLGACAPSARAVLRSSGRTLVVRIDDPAHRSAGEESYLSLAGTRVEPRENGFAVLESGGEVCAEYVFAKD